MVQYNAIHGKAAMFPNPSGRCGAERRIWRIENGNIRVSDVVLFRFFVALFDRKVAQITLRKGKKPRFYAACRAGLHIWYYPQDIVQLQLGDMVLCGAIHASGCRYCSLLSKFLVRPQTRFRRFYRIIKTIMSKIAAQTRISTVGG